MSDPAPFRSTVGYPKWIQTLDKAPRSKVVLGSMLGAMAISGMCSVLLMSKGEVVPTMNTDWKNATKEYMKFQKMNPIFGISRDQGKD